ncbi:MAG TPA: DUF5666 domain-containing protein [Candidatus Sulfotelmatobacter sp.]
MIRFFWMMTLFAGCAWAQAAMPATANVAGVEAKPATADREPPARMPGGKIGLVRGVVKRFDPIHDQLVIHTFGGGNVQIAFDPRTQLLRDNASTRFTTIPAGSVVSVDTVIDNGKLFARSVRASQSNVVELNGQIVSYDAGKSRLTLRDPISPESVSLHIAPSTQVVRRGQAASPQILTAGMLVKVRFFPAQHAASNIEILAEPGNSFTFEGRVVAVDLRSRVLDLSNDSDQSIRELALGSIDGSNLNLLQEGVEVSIQAEFDGDRYNIRTVTLLSRNP